MKNIAIKALRNISSLPANGLQMVREGVVHISSSLAEIVTPKEMATVGEAGSGIHNKQSKSIQE